MIKKGFTEAQIIFFVILLGICVLILVPIINKVVDIEKQKKYDQNVNTTIDASKRWLSDKEIDNLTDGDTFYISVDELVNQKYLSESKINGCVKITYQDKIKEYSYTYNTGTCQSIMTGKDIVINNVVTSGDGIYKIDKNYIFKGTNPNNYILINSISYRILSVDENGIKVIRNTSIEKRSWDSAGVRTSEKNSFCTDSDSGCNAYVSNGNEITQDSEIHQYLQTVYSKIPTAEKILNEKGNWKIGYVEQDYDPNNLNNLVSANTITSNIGLLNINDYMSASINRNYYKENWLNNGEEYWTLSGVSNTNNIVWIINDKGKTDTKKASETSGVRPVLNISGKINLSGSGTSDDPYVLNLK